MQYIVQRDKLHACVFLNFKILSSIVAEINSCDQYQDGLETETNATELNHSHYNNYRKNWSTNDLETPSVVPFVVIYIQLLTYCRCYSVVISLFH